MYFSWIIIYFCILFIDVDIGFWICFWFRGYFMLCCLNSGWWFYNNIGIFIDVNSKINVWFVLVIYKIFRKDFNNIWFFESVFFFIMNGIWLCCIKIRIFVYRFVRNIEIFFFCFYFWVGWLIFWDNYVWNGFFFIFCRVIIGV